jgi:MFS transporter, DHA3 family, macrolide efflux protein
VDPALPTPRDPGAVPPPAAAGRSGLRDALAHRPFFWLWSSQLISQSGDFVFEVALLWLVLQTTGSVFAVGVVVTATLIPGVVLGPVLGVYVDRWPRRTLLLVTNGLEAIIVASLSGLVLTHHVGLPSIVAIVTALGGGAQVVNIASRAMIPQTVPIESLPPANSLVSFSSSFNQVVGLSIGGVLVAVFGVTLPIEYDAVTFVLAAILVALIPSAVGRPTPPVAGVTPRFRAQFAEGLSFVRRHRFLVEVILLGIVVNFFANAIAALFAPYADLVLHGGPTTYGLLGAFVALGAIVGAFLAARVDTRRDAGRYLFGGSIGIGVLIAALGFTSSAYLALGETFALGVFLSLTNLPILSVIMAKVPNQLMGRVLSVLTSLVAATGPIGAFYAGTFAEAHGVPVVFAVSGLIIVICEGVGWFVMADLRTVSY